MYAPTLPNQNNFNGENINQSFALAWTATPVTNVDTRVYYYWTKLENNSSLIEYGNAPTQPLASGLGCGNFTPAGGAPTQIVGNCENELYNYTKNNVGFDVWWKFLRGNRLGFGWDYNDLDQTRVDYDKSHWNKLWVEYKNTMLDTLSGRLKYQYIKRDSTLNFRNHGSRRRREQPELPARRTRRRSTCRATRPTSSSCTLDWAPMQNVGVSFEGTWGKVDYDDVTFGRTSSDRQGYFLSGNWTASDRIKLNAFGSWEETKYPSNHRYIGTVAGGPTPPPGIARRRTPTATTRLRRRTSCRPARRRRPTTGTRRPRTRRGWSASAADWQAMDSLKLTASYLYINNEGSATFGYQNGIVLNNPPVLPINNFDNSTQQFFNLKGAWAYNKNWSFTAGYAYQKYSHDDIATPGLPVRVAGCGRQRQPGLRRA